jgi:hypothetical protein
LPNAVLLFVIFKRHSVEYHAVKHSHSAECHSAKRDSVYAVLLSFILMNVSET